VSKHDKANESLKAVHSQGTRFISSAGGKMSSSTKNKMIALYDTALKQSTSEATTLRKILADVERMRQAKFAQRISNQGKLPRGALMVLLAKHAQSLPLWVGETDGHPPAMVGAISSGVEHAALDTGDFVAAFVEDIWILAEVN
jgi:hypothetical protein